MDHETKSVVGEVADVFAHRFVIATADGRVLADLGPKGAERVAPKVGDAVEVTGVAKPSELKVSRIALRGGEPIEVPHGPGKGGHHGHGGDVDPSAALRAVEANGFAVVGEPRRRPRHFEVTGRDAAGALVELHVEFDGAIRKTKPARVGAP